ncbi:MAG: DUF115 domain-containing protein [Anaerolineales bacterium]|nr:DUF115 domain-containing protein [Anaerolineales bacterium]
MERFRREDITAGRLVDAVRRRIDDVPHILSWRFRSDRTEENQRRLRQYHNRHSGERCFIIGNGPSLKKTDLTLLRHEYTFGMNRIYLLFKELGFETTYFVSSNERVVEQFQEDIRALSMPRFLNWRTRALFDPEENSVLFFKLRLAFKDRFSPDPEHPISGGATVTYVALQLAYYMGFSQVILIGVDHSFQYKGTPNRFIKQDLEDDVNHFSPEYFPKGLHWQVPDLLHSEVAYRLAREAYEKNGRQILDATVDGQCPVFERVAFSSLFSACVGNLPREAPDT